MTQPFGEEKHLDALTKALGVIALIEMIDHMNQVVAGFEAAGVFTPEGTRVLSDKTSTYFDDLKSLIEAERQILRIQRSQEDI